MKRESKKKKDSTTFKSLFTLWIDAGCILPQLSCHSRQKQLLLSFTDIKMVVKMETDLLLLSFLAPNGSDQDWRFNFSPSRRRMSEQREGGEAPRELEMCSTFISVNLQTVYCESKCVCVRVCISARV